MQIGRSEGIDPQGLPDAAGKLLKTGQALSAAHKATEGPEAADPKVAEYARAAAGAEEVRPEAVKEARALLESGQLTSPEALQRTAESLLRLGI
jgi:hypothetical protein